MLKINLTLMLVALSIFAGNLVGQEKVFGAPDGAMKYRWPKEGRPFFAVIDPEEPTTSPKREQGTKEQTSSERGVKEQAGGMRGKREQGNNPVLQAAFQEQETLPPPRSLDGLPTPIPIPEHENPRIDPSVPAGTVPGSDHGYPRHTFTEPPSDPIGEPSEIFAAPYEMVGPRRYRGRGIFLKDVDSHLSVHWFRAEYLYWGLDGMMAPALATTSSAGTPITDAGVPGLDTTTTVFGGELVRDGSGTRYELGMRLDPYAVNGFSVQYFTFDESDSFEGNSSNFPTLARPFVSVEPGFEGPNAELIAFPGVYDGSLRIAASTKFDGGEAVFRHVFSEDCERRWSVLVGYRYAGLRDHLSVEDSRTVLDGSTGLAVGTNLSEVDRFETDNRFHGINLGVMGTARHERWTLEALMKLGVGTTRARALVQGSTTSSVPIIGGVDRVTTPGGLLALSTNSGQFAERDFAMIPELGLNLGFNLTRRIRATAGYTMIYWSRVARAGEQIDPLLNLSQLSASGLTGIARPEFDWTWNDFLAQGLNLGLDVQF
jgi:hypothetical protein